jgi:hypothetical protein
MSELATKITGEKRSIGCPEKSEKSKMKDSNWHELTKPLPCYLVMLISSIFQAILAVLLLPYNLLNRT